MDAAYWETKARAKEAMGEEAPYERRQADEARAIREDLTAFVADERRREQAISDTKKKAALIKVIQQAENQVEKINAADRESQNQAVLVALMLHKMAETFVSELPEVDESTISRIVALPSNIRERISSLDEADRMEPKLLTNWLNDLIEEVKGVVQVVENSQSVLSEKAVRALKNPKAFDEKVSYWVEQTENSQTRLRGLLNRGKSFGVLEVLVAGGRGRGLCINYAEMTGLITSNASTAATVLKYGADLKPGFEIILRDIYESNKVGFGNRILRLLWKFIKWGTLGAFFLVLLMIFIGYMSK